jgi:hypothetical protein
MLAQATQGFTPNRVHVWQLTEDVTIGGSDCTFSPAINITGPTTLLGEVASQSTSPSMRSYPLAAAVPAARAKGAHLAALLPAGPVNSSASDGGVSLKQSAESSDVSTGGQHGSGVVSAAGNTLHSLSFQFTSGLIQLPVDAPERYLQIRNITLWQLPQAHAPHGDHQNGYVGRNHSRRLMQASSLPVVGGLAAMPVDAHPGLFTILLWAFNR